MAFFLFFSFCQSIWRNLRCEQESAKFDDEFPHFLDDSIGSGQIFVQNTRDFSMSQKCRID